MVLKIRDKNVKGKIVSEVLYTVQYMFLVFVIV